jgi:uncharacterized protein
MRATIGPSSDGTVTLTRVSERSRVSEVLVGLLALAVVIAVAIPLTALIVMRGLTDLKKTDDTITVTGAATRTLDAAAATWPLTIAVHERTPEAAAQSLRARLRAVDKYLTDSGVKVQVTPRQPSVTQVTDQVRSGAKTLRVPAWEVRQQLDVHSDDVAGLDRTAAGSAPLLLNKTVASIGELTYGAPVAGGTEVSTLRLAAADARRNAAAVLDIVGGNVGSVRSIRLVGYKSSPAQSVSARQRNVTALVSVTFAVER